MTPSLHFEVSPTDKLTVAQHKAVVELCTAAYALDFSEFFGFVHVLGLAGGVLVSHAAWVTRWLQPAGHAPLRTAYVEAVATAPAHERKGFATATMRHLAEQILDFDLGGLSPSDPVFYARMGWESWRGPLSIRTEDGPLATPSEEVMILRLPRTPALDLDSPISAEWRSGELW